MTKEIISTVGRFNAWPDFLRREIEELHSFRKDFADLLSRRWPAGTRISWIDDRLRTGIVVGVTRIGDGLGIEVRDDDCSIIRRVSLAAIAMAEAWP